MILGLIITAISTMVAGITPLSAFSIIIIAGFGIAFGYLFGMSSGKAQCASKLNEFLAVEKHTTKIDSNASAGPIMLIDNIGNIIGPLFGSGMIYIFGFQGFFIVFALGVTALIIFSFKNFTRITGHEYVFQSPVKEMEIKKEAEVEITPASEAA